MVKIYLSVRCLLAVCCASHPAFLYKREIKLYVCILERLVVHWSYPSCSLLSSEPEKGLKGFPVYDHTLNITSCFKYYKIHIFYSIYVLHTYSFWPFWNTIVSFCKFVEKKRNGRLKKTVILTKIVFLS